MRTLTLSGDYEGAGKFLPALLEQLRSPGANAAAGWNQIGVYHHNTNQFAEAEDAYRKGIRLAEQAESHRPELALLLLNLGSLYLEMGTRYRHAESLIRRSYDLALELYEKDSPVLANHLQALAVARMKQGHSDEARRLFDQALASTGNTQPGRIQHGLILANLGVLLASAKPDQTAADTLLRALAILKDTLGENNPELVALHLGLARIYEQRGTLEDARQHIGLALEISELRFGPANPALVDLHKVAASILEKSGQRTEARQHKRQAKAIADAQQPRVPGREAWIHVSDLVKRDR